MFKRYFLFISILLLTLFCLQNIVSADSFSTEDEFFPNYSRGLPPTSNENPISVYPEEIKTHYYLPLLGEFDFAQSSILLTTIIIAFVDGLNPCSLWVISFLLTIVVYTRSRKKILLVGLTFLLVTTLAYGTFMVGLLNVFYYTAYLRWIQLIIALTALFFGLVNIKDYFWFKRGFSLTIPDKYKPGIFRNFRRLISRNTSSIGLVIGTITLALGVVLVELPCTAGFPMIWSNLMTYHNFSKITYFYLLLIYLLIYVLDELLIIFLAVFTMKMGRLEEKSGRVLKLIGGMIMIFLAGVMIWKPSLMNDFMSTLKLFILAFLFSITLIFIDLLFLDKFKKSKLINK